MKITMWPGDRGGCAFHRIRLPAGICNANGLHVEVADHFPGRRNSSGKVEVLVQGIETDVLVIQRPLYRNIVESIPKLQEEGITVVVEIDDDLHAICKEHQAYKTIHPLANPDMNWDWFKIACETCDFLTCTTQALADRYGREGRYAVIPNYIAKEITEIEPKDPMFTVGWTSNVKSHPNDLQVTGGGVGRAISEAGAQMYVIGEPDDVKRNLSLDAEPICPGWAGHVELYYMLRAMRVGIVPLEDSAFNQSKSNLKGLEFASQGIPFCASPTVEYLDLAAHGAGTICTHPVDWYENVYDLLTDDDRRQEDGMLAKQVVLDHYLLEDHWHLYPEAWEKAWKIKHNGNGTLISEKTSQSNKLTFF